MNTIAAIATPLGAGAISVVRISGDDALVIAAKCFKTAKLKNFVDAEPNFMYLGEISCEGFKDKCFAVYFHAPKSYTGEEVVEFQCHGGVRLAQEVMRTVCEMGAKPADKGEFTKRAFLNGKVNLAEAEGIVDMIVSENIASLNAGYRLMSGKLNAVIKAVADEILDLSASMEACLDYPEELEEEVRENSAEILGQLHISLKELLTTAKLGRIIKSGINIAIIGSPNIGKSSLLNAILGKERAIVTDIAGTTRDTLEERIEVDGIFLNFIDTAGIRDTMDTVEKIGVNRAFESADKADLIIYMLDSSLQPTAKEMDILKTYANKKVLKVYNKCDLGVLPSNGDGMTISAKSGENIDKLLKTIVEMFVHGSLDASGEILTNLRHINAIERAFEFIKSANYACGDSPIECTLIDLKAAYGALGEITGDTASEDIIDRIFSKFCLGK